MTAQQIIVYATSFIYHILPFSILNLADIGRISLLTATTAIFTILTQPALPLAANHSSPAASEPWSGV